MEEEQKQLDERELVSKSLRDEIKEAKIIFQKDSPPISLADYNGLQNISTDTLKYWTLEIDRRLVSIDTLVNKCICRLEEAEKKLDMLIDEEYQPQVKRKKTSHE